MADKVMRYYYSSLYEQQDNKALDAAMEILSQNKQRNFNDLSSCFCEDETEEKDREENDIGEECSPVNKKV